MLTKILSEQIIINYSIEGLKIYQQNSAVRNVIKKTPKNKPCSIFLTFPISC